MPAHFAPDASSEGLALLSRMRADSDVPIVVISDHSSGHSEERALSLGTDSFFRKPPEIASLRTRLAELLPPGADN